MWPNAELATYSGCQPADPRDPKPRNKQVNKMKKISQPQNYFLFQGLF